MKTDYDSYIENGYCLFFLLCVLLFINKNIEWKCKYNINVLIICVKKIFFYYNIENKE